MCLKFIATIFHSYTSHNLLNFSRSDFLNMKWIPSRGEFRQSISFPDITQSPKTLSDTHFDFIYEWTSVRLSNGMTFHSRTASFSFFLKNTCRQNCLESICFSPNTHDLISIKTCSFGLNMTFRWKPVMCDVILARPQVKAINLSCQTNIMFYTSLTERFFGEPNVVLRIIFIFMRVWHEQYFTSI